MPHIDSWLDKHRTLAHGDFTFSAGGWRPHRDVVILVGATDGIVAAFQSIQQTRLFALAPSGPITGHRRSYAKRGALAAFHQTASRGLASELINVRLLCFDHQKQKLADDTEAEIGELFAAVDKTQAEIQCLMPLLLGNFLRNMRHIANTPSVAPLKDVLAGQPAVIVTPGPSLEKNVATLHKAKGQALIIATSRPWVPLGPPAYGPTLWLPLIHKTCAITLTPPTRATDPSCF